MTLRQTISGVHRRIALDLVTVGCILLFWVLIAEVTAMMVTADPIGAISWAEVPTFAFLLAAAVNAVLYLGARLFAVSTRQSRHVSS